MTPDLFVTALDGRYPLGTPIGVPAISTGEIFRSNVADGTELGRRAQQFIDRGEYVPDPVTNAMVAERLARPDAARGFLLDGYPRTRDQVGALDAMLAQTGSGLDLVLEITAEAEAVVARLLRRATEQGRADDTEPVIRRRLEVYAAQTQPLAEIYRSRGLLVQVDGMGEVQEVFERIVRVLSTRAAVS